MKRLQLLFVLLLGILAEAWCLGISGDIRFSHIGLEEGLSHSTVFAINQDGEGNMWFATYDGVNRYDGYNFTVYRHHYSDTCSVASDISRCVMIDSDGRVWIGTRDGLSLYNGRLGNFSNYYCKKNGQNLTVTHIVEVEKDKLLLGTSEGILLFDVVRRCFADQELPTSLHGIIPTAMTREGDALYIGVNGGMYVYRIEGKELKKLVNTPQGVGVQDILCMADGKLWLATGGDGLYRYDAQWGKLKKYRSTGRDGSLSSNYVRSLALDTDNHLWIGSYGGLNIYREDTDDFLSMKNSEIEDGSLSQNSVRDIFKDSQGGMWLGTYWGGVNYYHPYSNRFHGIKHIPLANSLKGDVVCCIAEDANHDLWIGTSDGGLNFYNHISRQYKSYSLSPDGLDVPFRDIKTIYVDEAQNKVYVGAHAGGMMVLNGKTGKVEYYNRQNSNLPSNNVYSIISDGNGGLWVATLEHLLHFDANKRDFSIVDRVKAGSPMWQNYVLFRDSRNRIWVGGEKGVAVFRQEGTSLVPDARFKASTELKSAFVSCFYESADGCVWIGTRNGLFGVKDSETEVRRYTADSGLPSNVVYGVLEDAFHRLWISTNQGLSCLNFKTGKFRNFTVFDGLLSNQFNAGAYCRRSNGDMLFGGVNGMTCFHPETLADNPYAPKPVINKLFVYNKEVLPHDGTGILDECISYTDHITLQSSQNSFALSFVVSNYIAGKHNTFTYKLDGFDKTWYKQSDISPVVYSNLPAGDYTFYVKAANNDGVWNDEPAVLHIRVLPVWYRTWWAILLGVLLVASAVGVVLRFFWLRNKMKTEIQMERLDKEKQEEISQMKIRFYVNISHELRTPLTLIVTPLQELLNRVSGHWEHERLLYIQRNAKRLLHLVNQLMDFRRAELGIFELRVVRANAYKRVLSCFANYENLAKRRDIDYNFFTELQDETELFDENYLDLITNNLLSNAFKYTDSGESITVKLFRDDEFLVLQVADTGVGIPKEKQGKIFERFYQVENGQTGSGVGLSLIQRLVELHHGYIDLQSEVGKGSTFSIYFPQDPSEYSEKELLLDGEAMSEQRVYSTNAHDVYVEEESEAQGGGLVDGDTKKRGTVLVVEDNRELRKYLTGGLGDMFSLYEAENGQQALEILKEQDVDLIVTDVMMPVMDGVKLCKAVKQNLRTCHIPVYMLSAKADVECQLEGLQVGADDYMAKPFSMEVLKAKIGNMLRTRSRIFDRYSKSTEIEPEKLANNAMDEELLRKAIAVVERNMDNVEFSTEQFAREMNMSRSNLHLKLKAITGKSAIDFIHKIRFGRACQLLKEGKYTVSEISFMVGYNTPSYFTARFKKYMGCLPTEYEKKQ